MATAARGRARVGRTGIVVVAVEVLGIPAVPTVAGFLAVADVAVRARGAGRLILVLAAGIADARAAVAALVDGAETRVRAVVVAGTGVSAGGEQQNEGEDER